MQKTIILMVSLFVVAVLAYLHFAKPKPAVDAMSNQQSHSAAAVEAQSDILDTNVDRDEPSQADAILGPDQYKLYKEEFVHFVGGDQGTYPESPLSVYKTNIDAALAGDSEAMYHVKMALDTCAGQLKDDFEFDAYIASNPSIASEVLHFQKARDFCRDLWAFLPQDLDLLASAREWNIKSANAGYPPAQLELFFSPSSSFEPKVEFDAVATDTAKIGTAAALQTVIAYIGFHRTRESIFPVDAWELVACRRSENCDSDVYEEWGLWELLPVERERVMEQASELESALDNGDLTSIWKN